MENNLLKKHDSKSFLKAFILGIIIGLAIIVPGISGSTVAIIFGMYAALLYAIGNILTDFKRCVAYLFPIAIGVVIGFLGGFLVVQRFFGEYTFILICLFAGLMIGAIPAILAEIEGEKRTPLRFILLGLGVLVPVAVSAVSILLGDGNASSAADATFTDFPASLFILYVPLGILVAATQVIPGLSATAILMAFGQFKPILNSLHLDYILANPIVLLLYFCIGMGFLGGLVIVSKLFSKLIEKHRGAAFFFVVGLSFGSIVTMFFNLDTWEIYNEWAVSGVYVTSVIIGAVLAIVGFACSFPLTKYELKKNKEKEESK